MSAPGFVWSDAAIAGALGVPASSALQCTGVSTDTREIKAGALFVALKGERFDAHDFLAQAKERGAVAAVVRKGTPPTPGLPYFVVPDTLVALGRLARARRRALPAGAPGVAGTGSGGETSTPGRVRGTPASPRGRACAPARSPRAARPRRTCARTPPISMPRGTCSCAGRAPR